MQNGCATDVWGLRGLAPVGALHTPHRAEARFWLAPFSPPRYMQSRPHRTAPMRGQIAAVKVKFSIRGKLTFATAPLSRLAEVNIGKVR